MVVCGDAGIRPYILNRRCFCPMLGCKEVFVEFVDLRATSIRQILRLYGILGETLKSVSFVKYNTYQHLLHRSPSSNMATVILLSWPIGIVAGRVQIVGHWELSCFCRLTKRWLLEWQLSPSPGRVAGRKPKKAPQLVGQWKTKRDVTHPTAIVLYDTL